MKEFDENEIQVLEGKKEQIMGKKGSNSSKIWKTIIIILIIAVIAIILALILLPGKSETSSPAESELGYEPPRDFAGKSNPISAKIQHSEVIKKDFIQDNIPLNVYLLVNLKAELSFETPDPKDESIFLAFYAADVRGDNYKVIGDFVINGQQFSKGTPREGFCSIINGNINIGCSKDNDMLYYCLENEGDFFRQLCLVHNGIMQPMKNNAKEKRRALAMQDNELYFIETKYGESLRAFAIALANMGLNEAINLPGGPTPLLICKENGENKVYGKDFKIENQNFLIFRGKN